jgi:alpha-ketoglutarate-dependent taurine dioxygenase
VQRINELTEEESAAALDWFVRLIADNHDLQIRHRWQNKNDLGKLPLKLKINIIQSERISADLGFLAIWDNRSVLHTATWDYEGLGPRTGQRAVSLGERPYFDPESKSRRQDLAEKS